VSRRNLFERKSIIVDEELHYIEDEKGRKLHYRFTPAAFISNFTPLIVVLHDERGKGSHHFEYKMWNVLTPVNSREEENDLCWLGEKDDYYIKELLQILIREMAEEYDCEEHIYLYGKGVGGYGAILHGILSQAHTVYAHKAKIRLEGLETEENDLSNLVNKRNAFPIVYLCDDNTSNSEVKDFIEACKRDEVNIDLDHCIKEDGEVETLKEVLNMLEKMSPD